jgi:hypothetical protein
LIDSNVTLTVLPGTFVHINGYYSIQTYGVIRAIGTLTDSIVFTHLDTIQHADTSTTKGGWHGIRLLPRSSTDTSFFKFCRIANGKAVVSGSYWPYYDNPDNLGGNVYAFNFGNLVMENCFIVNGRVKAEGAGLYLNGANYTLIDHCHFKYNFAYTAFGGGACIWGVDSLVVRNNLFNYNTMYNFDIIGAGGSGGAIAIINGPQHDMYALIVNNRFFNNYTLYGTIYDAYINSNIVSNVICNNRGGAIGVGAPYSYPIYSNNTMVNNVGYGFWSGVMIYTPFATLSNNIIRHNYAEPYDPIEQIYYGWDNQYPPLVNNCNIQFGWEGEGEGNIDLEPQFINPTPEWSGYQYDALNSDWSLQNSSPCVNTGTLDTTGLNLPEFDIAGNPRFYGIRVDMGAYENQVVVGLPNNPLVNSKIEIIPNPFKDSFSINLFGENKINRITVLNQSGITIRNLEHLPTDGFMIIDLNTFPSGLYLVVVEYEDGTRRVEKVLKQ